MNWSERQGTDVDAAPRNATRRLAREDWIAFAKKVLVRSGIESVKIDAIAKKARVTRGSFYHHFENRQDLLDALLRDWEVRNLVEVSSIRDRWARGTADLSDLTAIWLSEERAFLDFDMAIRSWARQAQEVADVVWRVDRAWLSLLEKLFAFAGYEGDERVVRARITYFHQIGYHALAFREDRKERVRLLPIYHRLLMGVEPGAEFDRMMQTIIPPKRGKKPSKQHPN